MPGEVEPFDAEVVVRRTRYASEETGWAVIDAADADGEPVVLVGPLVHLEAHERAHITGTWVDDSRYGLQVKVAQAEPLPPADAETVAIYLRRVKHIGGKRAATLIEQHGAAGVLDAIDRDPAGALAAAGLTHRRAQEAAASWEALRVTRQLHMLLAPHGLAYLVKRIHIEYGDGAHRIVRERPYELTSVFGVGFLIADRIAQAAGTAVDRDDRARAGLLHTLSEAERGGSTCLPMETLLATLRELLGGVEVRPAFVDELVARGDLVREGDWIYRRATAELEAELAERVAGAGAQLVRRASAITVGRRPWHRADRRAAGRRRGRVRTSTIPDHRRSRNRQDGIDQDDRRNRHRPRREGAARRANRPGGDPDDRSERDCRANRALRARLDPRRRPDPRRG